MGDLTLALAGHRHPGTGRTRHYQDSVRDSQHTGGGMTSHHSDHTHTFTNSANMSNVVYGVFSELF